MRSADSYSSEGLHLDPRGVPARYLDARMQSPRLARVPHRLAPAPADFRVPHYSSKDALDMARRMREPVERPDWHSAPATYFMGANLSPHVEPAMPGFNPVSHPPHFSGGVRGGGPPEALNLGPARVYLTTQQQPSSAGCEEPLHTEPVTEGGTSQDEPPGVPKLKSIRESEEREPLPGRPDKVGGVEGAPRTGEGWERPSQPRRAVEVQGEGRGEGLAALRLERQASGGSSGGPEQQSEGRNAVLEEGPATKERWVGMPDGWLLAEKDEKSIVGAVEVACKKSFNY